MKYLASVLLILGLSLPVRATDYYVDSNDAGCANNGTHGTEAMPWCTLGYALGTGISGGDTVYVRGGTHQENLSSLSCPDGLDANNPTRILAYPGESPVFDNNGAGRMRCDAWDYWQVSGIGITDMNQGFYCYDCTFGEFSGNTITNVQQEAIAIRSDSSFITLSDNTIDTTGTILANGEGFYIGGETGAQDNTNNLTIRGNTLSNTYTECIELKPGTHDIIVEGNTCVNTGTAFTTNVNIGRCVENERLNLAPHTYGSNPDYIIRNNLCHGTTGPAIRLGSGGYVYNNLVYDIDSGDRGILLDNLDSDAYTRYAYHNTVNVSSTSLAIVEQNSPTTDIQNNIGPPTAGNNLAYNAAWFVNPAGGDFTLVNGSTPIDAGADLRATVPTDINGYTRDPTPDIGAFEYDGDAPVIIFVRNWLAGKLAIPGTHLYSYRGLFSWPY